MSISSIAVRLILATIMGGLLGLEREKHGSFAGLRTHMLVALGSSLFMVSSVLVSASYGSLGNIDPSRIAAGIVTGIGFLGAGTIIHFRSGVHGLTTAASIWTVSAIGLTIGAGFYATGVIATVVALIVLLLSRHSKDSKEL